MKDIFNLENVIDSITYFMLTVVFFIAVPFLLNKFNLWGYLNL